MNNVPAIFLDPNDPCSPLAVPSSKTVLLLLDFHKFIVASQPNQGRDVVGSAQILREWARRQNITVLHCLIDLKATTAATRKMAQRTNQIRDKMRVAPPETIGEAPEVAASADEYVFWRPPGHVSAMGSYGLRSFLEEHEIQSLIVAGFSSSGCVVNTAKGAADAGFTVTVVKDACGDKMADAHEMIMEKLLVGQCHVADREMFVGAWDESKGQSISTLPASMNGLSVTN